MLPIPPRPREHSERRAMARQPGFIKASKRTPDFWWQISGYFICPFIPPIAEHTVLKVDLMSEYFFSFLNTITTSFLIENKTSAPELWLVTWFWQQCILFFDHWHTDKSLTTSSLAKPMPKLSATPHVSPCTELQHGLLPSCAGWVRSRDHQVPLKACLLDEKWPLLCLLYGDCDIRRMMKDWREKGRTSAYLLYM